MKKKNLGLTAAVGSYLLWGASAGLLEAAVCRFCL